MVRSEHRSIQVNGGAVDSCDEAMTGFDELRKSLGTTLERPAFSTVAGRKVVTLRQCLQVRLRGLLKRRQTTSTDTVRL